MFRGSSQTSPRSSWRSCCSKKPSTLPDGTKDAAEWNALDALIDETCNRYACDLGENDYAVFNVVTEFASNPLRIAMCTVTDTAFNVWRERR